MTFIKTFFSYVGMLLFATPLLAFDVVVKDQFGKLVSDAFVALPIGQIDKPKTKPAIMDQVDVEFVPHVLAIDKGQAVIFPNSDNIRHHVYSFSDPKKFEIKLYQGVPEKPIRFEKPGLVALGCNIHDSMLGYIYVSPWPDYAVTGEEGRVTLSQSHKELAIWHPRLKDATGVLIKKINADQQVVTVSLELKKQKKQKFRTKRRDAYDF